MSARFRFVWWLLALALLIAIGLAALRRAAPRTARPIAAATSLDGKPLPVLGAAGWKDAIASPESLVGRVVVVGLVSLDLPRSLRVLPSLEAWHEAYARYGVRVLGVHVPAFAFSADSAGSSRAVERLGLRFPVALDPSLEVWRSFGAEGTPPRIVIADPRGRVAWDSENVESVAEGERALRALVLQANPELRFPAGSEPAPSAPRAEHAAVHLGQARIVKGPLAHATPGRAVSFTAQLRYQVEGESYTPYPVGRWIPSADGLTAARGGAENFVALRYDAGALGAVVGPPESGPVRLWILRDDRWLTREEAGADVQFDGRGASYVMVNQPRLYAIAHPTSGEHVIKLSPDLEGITIYALTFEPFAAEPRP
jgi:hypothetical protein